MASKQVAVTSDLSGQLWTVCVWDILTGTTLATYKGSGVCRPRTLTTVGDDFLVAAENDKSIIYFWSLKEKSDKHQKVVCPGRITALAVTPDAGYCIVAISEKIYVWQLSTGNLMNVLERHYQPVNVIKTSTDGSFFVSGGDDGLVLAWFLPEIIANANDNQLNDTGSNSGNEARHVWSSHSAKVTDVAISHGGVAARCASCSLDKTCRIYELASGRHLLTLVFDTGLCSVAMDPAQYFVFVGGDNGAIYETKLYAKPSQLESRRDEETQPAFVGHKGKVTCLSVSIDGLALISGSHDNNIKVWHILSKQCMRDVQHKGPVGNAFVIPTPHGLLNEPSKPSKLVIKQFRRNNAAFDDSSDAGTITMKLPGLVEKNKRVGGSNEDSNHSKELRIQVDELKKINEELYNYAAEQIFKVR